jgi:putative ABC transport system substrate-binding protein
MKRRDLVVLLGGAAVAWPLSAPAQQAGKMARIGYLSPQQIPREMDPVYGSFLRGLQGRGYVEGRTIAIESRFAPASLQMRRIPTRS